MALSSNPGKVKFYITMTSAGRRKVAGINRTMKDTLSRDMDLFADRTQRKARDLAPKATGRLRSFIDKEQVPTGEGIEMWAIVSKNPIPGSPTGGKGIKPYRNGGNNTNFDLAYWAAKSQRALAHFRGGKARYMDDAEKWAEENIKDYVRSGRYKRKLKQYKR
jgi:hypothetical protein